MTARKTSKKPARKAAKTGAAKSAKAGKGAKKATRKAAPARKKAPAKKKAAAGKAASAPTAPPTPAKPAKQAAAGGPSSLEVNMGHVFALRPRVPTSFRPADFLDARQRLSGESFESLPAAARAVAAKALELTHEQGARRGRKRDH